MHSCLERKIVINGQWHTSRYSAHFQHRVSYLFIECFAFFRYCFKLSWELPSHCEWQSAQNERKNHHNNFVQQHFDIEFLCILDVFFACRELFDFQHHIKWFRLLRFAVQEHHQSTINTNQKHQRPIKVPRKLWWFFFGPTLFLSSSLAYTNSIVGKN